MEVLSHLKLRKKIKFFQSDSLSKRSIVRISQKQHKYSFWYLIKILPLNSTHRIHVNIG